MNHEFLLFPSPKGVSNNPFEEEDSRKISLVFLGSKPTEEAINRLSRNALQLQPIADRFEINGKEIYLLIEGPFHKTKLTHQFFEKNLAVKATIRNWKTVSKMVELSG